MSEEDTTVDESGDDGATYTKADLSRILQERLGKERAKFGDYAALKAKASKLDELEAANKTAAEKDAEARQQAERERDEARLALLRRDVAEDAGLPRAWAARLRGSTKEELEADAKELAKEVAPRQQQTTARPVPELRSGALPASDSRSNDPDSWIRGQARR